MLTLHLAGPDEAGPPLLNTADPAVQIWPADDGSVNAYAHFLNGYYWLQVPRVASFRFTVNSDEVLAFAKPAARPERVRDVYRRVVLPMALQALGWEVLHASAVLLGGRVAALCGEPETGKSTSAYGLSQRGYQLWADDAVALQLSGDGVQATPLPFRLRLRPTAAMFFGLGGAALDHASRHESQVHTPAEAATLGAVCLLRRVTPSDTDAPVEISRLSPVKAFPAVLAHATCFSFKDATRNRLMMEHYLRLTAQVPVLDIRFRAGMETLAPLLDGIEQATKAAWPVPS